MTDWNPNDPDATRVYYDLAAWSFDQQAELASTMADAGIPHAWDNTELMVPEEFEDLALTAAGVPLEILVTAAPALLVSATLTLGAAAAATV